MKKFARLFALAFGLATMLFTSCSNITEDAVITTGVESSDNYKSLTLNITSNSKLLEFEESASEVDGSRTILPTAQKCDNLWFYLCSKNNTAGDSQFSKPVAVTVTKKSDDTTGHTGEVVINLTKADYDFKLYAVPRGDSTSATSYTSEADCANAAVLVGYANADIRNDDTVSFYLTAEGLSKTGSVALKLYTKDWKLSDFSGYNAAAQMTYTKKTTLSSSSTANEGDLVNGTNIPQGDAIFAIPATAPESANYTATASPGTYNFEVSFSNGSKTYTWSDRIIILPGQATEKEIGIPLVIEKAPLAPDYFNAAYIDPELSTTEYYNVEFVWSGKHTGTESGATAEDINNEEKFELQLMSIPSAIDSQKITTYTTVIKNAGKTVTEKKQAWNTLRDNTVTENAGGKTVIWSTIDDKTKAENDDSAEVDTKVFYGNLETWVAGSLQKNNEYAIFKLPLGSRYVARIRAVNAAGASDWVYADIAKDIKGEGGSLTGEKLLNASSVAGTKDAYGFTSETINRFRVKYDFAGGTGTYTTTGETPTEESLEKVFYYCQAFGTETKDNGKITNVEGGISIMKPTGPDEYKTDGTVKKHNEFTITNSKGVNGENDTVIQDPKLVLGSKMWTNWLKDNSPYNEVNVAPFNYIGCKNLTLVANYATIGLVTIFDDNDYAIVNVTSASTKAGGTATISSDAETETTVEGASAVTTIKTKAVVYTITASQSKDVTLIWTVTYPTGKNYDNVTLICNSTDGNRSYNIGDIQTDTNGVHTFTIKISEFVKGVYNAKISAWSSVKTQDPYTANISLTVVD